MSRWTIDVYKTVRGRSPVEEFFDSLSDDEMARVDRKLQLLGELGTSLDPPHVDHLRGKIWELRVPGKNQQRVLYAAVEGKRILLLHGFTKKTRATPKNEIDIAEKRYNDDRKRSNQR